MAAFSYPSLDTSPLQTRHGAMSSRTTRYSHRTSLRVYSATPSTESFAGLLTRGQPCDTAGGASSSGEISFGVQRGDCPRPCRSNRLPVRCVEHISGDEHAGEVRARTSAIHCDRPVAVEVELPVDQMGARISAY